MTDNRTICLLNDSFPPVIDGVANTVVNYAANINAHYGRAFVVTPEIPGGADDSAFPYPVIRYPSIDTRKAFGYVTGNPFAPGTVYNVLQQNPDLLHLHCPMVSAMLAWQLRETRDIPLILTWHSKFDTDISAIVHSRLVRDEVMRTVLSNVNACDEVWAVSQGAGDDLRNFGYEGEIIVMQNGVDLPLGRVPDNEIGAITKDYDLPAGVPVFLFVGRMKWYKGLRIILEALARLRQRGKDFRMLFIGGGGDFDEVKALAENLNLTPFCIFTGPIRDREKLRAWYSRANLLLFPSAYDTNGLVVREAAACGTGTVMLGGSCASEGVTDGRNGFLIDSNAESMAACLLRLYEQQTKAAEVGLAAQKELYISWEEAVRRATERYEIVLDRHKSGQYQRLHQPRDLFMKSHGKLMEFLGEVHAEAYATRDDFLDEFLSYTTYVQDRARSIHEKAQETKAAIETKAQETRTAIEERAQERKTAIQTKAQETKAAIEEKAQKAKDKLGL